MAKIKITGVRSVETKTMRLSCDLRDDARRVRSDYDGTRIPYAVFKNEYEAAKFQVHFKDCPIACFDGYDNAYRISSAWCV